MEKELSGLKYESTAQRFERVKGVKLGWLGRVYQVRRAPDLGRLGDGARSGKKDEIRNL